MDRQLLYQIIYAQQKDFLQAENLIDRAVETEFNRILKAKMPIMITGIRRCGKSSLLKLMQKTQEQWLYINFNDERLLDFSTEDFQKILDYIKEQKYGKNCALFLDEIQEISNWEKWIDRIKDDYVIFITGSNSKLLSGELASILTGRAISMNLYPFSFKEYLNAKSIRAKSWNLDLNIQSEIRTAMNTYLEYGGFPRYVMTGQIIVITELYENILYKDIISRFNKNQIRNIKEITQYLISNISKPISFRTLANISGIKNLSTIKRMIDSLENAFLIFVINKFDYSMRKQVQNPKKIYCIDNGILTARGFNFSENSGRLLENAVFLQLKRSKHEIYYHKDKHECDFITKENKKITAAIQVCYSLNENNKQREITGLIEAMRKYNLKTGTIITYDQESEIKEDNIKIIPIWKWILENETFP